MRPSGRTLPKATDKNDMYSREFPTRGNFLFFIFLQDEPVLPAIGKLAFAQRSAAMKAPVGLLSTRITL